MYPFYLGIDLHLKGTYAVLMDPTGKFIPIGAGTFSDKRRIKNPDIIEYLRENVPQETYGLGSNPQLGIHVRSIG